ncbi:AfsR/SARP family transcriptional regulator [Nonomuraea soli]|uniref:AfsR/SARP family transcriptional regulator n=1 Tax=Nonomuraea soli TaxID=1032476 RepID=UPI00248386B7|nr:BTAD domain-containing putative transcriptional regulator [Nonomuraea soli]
MNFSILGGLEVVREGTLIPIRSVKQSILLAILLCRVGELTPTDVLVDALWGPDHQEGSATRLRLHIHRLRRLLGDTAQITYRAPGYVLHVPPQTIDSWQFEALAGEARRFIDTGDPTRGSDLLRSALDLWRGPALSGLEGVPLLQQVAVRLAEKRIRALALRIDADLALGRHADLIGEIHGLVQEYPLQERFRAQLMTALYRDGRQPEALQIYREGRDLLRTELGLEPSIELSRLEHAILNRDPSLLPRVTEREPAPPFQAGFVGRARELVELSVVVRRTPLVTLVGPPGVGKSRLARELGEREHLSYPGGIWTADLANVSPSSPTLWATATDRDGNTLPLAELLWRLSASPALLILDNCDPLRQEFATLTRDLHHTLPELRIVATCRQRLPAEGQSVWRVAPLALPYEQTVQAVRSSPAGQLFIEQASSVDREFTLCKHNAAEVARICRAVDGIPLALELAGQLTVSIPVEQLAVRLDRQLDLLARSGGDTPRHASLRAAIEWSYARLSGEEQRAFDQLSVFTRPFRMEDARTALARGGMGVTAERMRDLVGIFIEHSLLYVERAQDGTRYRLLEMLRQYAAQQLARSPAG